MTLLGVHVIDAVSTDADALRRALQTLSPGQISAVLGTNDLKVTAGGGMVSSMAAGKGLVLGSQNTTSQGHYGVTNDAAVTQTHSASDPTNPRNDLVGVKVEDAFYAGSNKQATPVIVTGTPAASPVDPAAPSNWLPLARVRVNAGASSLGTITDLRSWVWQTVLPGGGGFAVRDSTNAANNLAVSDVGQITLRNAIWIPPTAAGTPAATSYGSLPVKIAEYVPTVGGTNQSITIPSGFRKIAIDMKMRHTSSATSVDLRAQCNGSSATDYAWTRLYAAGNSGSWAANEGTADTGMTIGFIAGTTPGKGFSYVILELIDYSDASNDHSFKAEGTSVNGYTTGGVYITKASGFWKPAASAAITSLLVYTAAAQVFATGCLMTVWGYP